MVTILSIDEYKNLLVSLAKKTFNLDKASKATKGFTSAGHLIVRDAKGNTVEIKPPKYVIDLYKSLKEAKDLRSEYQRLLLIFIKEVKETGRCTALQTSRIQDVYKLYESVSASWQHLNNVLQIRLTNSIDNISTLSDQHNDLIGKMHNNKLIRVKNLNTHNENAYTDSVMEFYRLNKSIMLVSRALDEESRKLTENQVSLIEPPAIRREDIVLSDIRVKLI